MLDHITTALHIAAVTAGGLWGFWGLYVLVMGLYRAKLQGRLTREAYVMGWPYYAIGLAVDLLANLTIFSLLMLELPREWLVTSRLKRHIAAGSGWRHDFAAYLCDNLLDPLDPKGEHC